VPALDIRLLGQLYVSYGGNPVETLGSPRLQSLLAYLLLHRGTPLSRQHVAFLFWPDSTDAQARTNLRKALHDLRRALPDADAFLEADTQTIRWIGDEGYVLDVAAFEAALAQAERGTELEGIAETGAGPVRLLGEAAELYAGDLLPSCYDEWIIPERQRLRARYLEGLERLAGLLEEAGDYGGAIEQTQRLLRDEPLHEPGHRRLMRLLAMSGQRSAALSQYQTCARLLDEELGVEPGQETKQLYELIRSGGLVAARERAQLQREAALQRHNLPAVLTPLIGRSKELAQLAGLLRDPACRLVTLSGPGGSGKTRLALELAAQQVGSYRDGVYLVRLAGVLSVESIAPAIAEAISVPLYGGPSPLQQVLDYLHEREMLLVLDNFEHLLAGVGIVLDILRTASGVKMLATSRSELGLSGEQVYPVQGLDVPDVGQAREEVAEHSAVQLFVASARRLRPGFALTQENAAGVVQACHMVEGLPLGIMLAAAWIELLTPGEIAREISRDLGVLEADWPDVPARQRSMRAVFDHSWELLSAQERTVMAALSVFEGGFGQEAAEMVADADLRDLRQLVHKSLLQCAERGRYELHELLRQYAVERLEERRTTEAVRSRHSRYYAEALRRWRGELVGPRQLDALAEMDTEIRNVRAAWGWAVGHNLTADLLQGMEGLCRYYEWRGHHREGAVLCQALGSPLPATASCGQVRLHVQARTWCSVFSGAMGRTEAALRDLEDAAALLDRQACEGHDVRAERAFLLRQAGYFSREGFDHVRAGQFYDESLALARETGDQWREADVLNELGWLASARDAWAQAEHYSRQSLAIQRALGDRVGIALSLRTLSHDALYQGRLQQAVEHAQASVDVCRETGDERGISYGLGYLGYAQVASGRFAEAREALEESVAIARDRAVVRPRLFLDIYLGMAQVHLGMAPEARVAFEGIHAPSQEAAPWGARQLAAHGMAMLAIWEEAYAEATALLRDVVSAARAAARAEWLGLGLATMTYVHRHTEVAKVDSDIAEALRVCLQIQFPLPRLFALPAIALVLLDRGEQERAIELYAAASRHAFVARSHWFDAVVGQPLAAATGTLSPQAVAAAQERGQVRDLEATLEGLLAEFAR
jgi:predicted ATPase/DNA-binding SARP family transcriptional activator